MQNVPDPHFEILDDNDDRPLEVVERYHSDLDGLLWSHRYSPYVIVAEPQRVPFCPRRYLFRPSVANRRFRWPIHVAQFPVQDLTNVSIYCYNHPISNLGCCVCFTGLPPINVRIYFRDFGLEDVLLRAAPRAESEAHDSLENPITVIRTTRPVLFPLQRFHRRPWISLPSDSPPR